MEFDKLVNYLKEFGFTIYESRILSYLLCNGSSSAVEMSNSLNIPNTKIYYVLDKLYNHGYILKKEGKPVHYCIESRVDFFNVVLSKFKKRIEYLCKLKEHILNDLDVIVHTKVVDSLNEVKYYLTRNLTNIKILCSEDSEFFLNMLLNKNQIVFIKRLKEVSFFSLKCDQFFLFLFFDGNSNFLVGFITEDKLDEFNRFFV